MQKRFVLLTMSCWDLSKDYPVGVERILLQDEGNLTGHLQTHIRMMCEEFLPDNFTHVPRSTLDAINQYTFSDKKKIFEFDGNPNTNHIEVKCEYKDEAELL